MDGADRDRLLSGAAGLPAGPCKVCEREVLAYPRDGDVHACVHCDQPLRRVFWVDESDLEHLGYDMTDPLLAGCGTGCANGGCTPQRR